MKILFLLIASLFYFNFIIAQSFQNPVHEFQSLNQKHTGHNTNTAFPRQHFKQLENAATETKIK